MFKVERQSCHLIQGSEICVVIDIRKIFYLLAIYIHFVECKTIWPSRELYVAFRFMAMADDALELRM
jgi:hypothetical protein